MASVDYLDVKLQSNNLEGEEVCNKMKYPVIHLSKKEINSFLTFLIMVGNI